MPRGIENLFARGVDGGVTKHSKVLLALEKRALWYCRKSQTEVDMDKVFYDKALNETGIVSIAGLTDSDNESLGSETFREPIIAAEATYLER